MMQAVAELCIRHGVPCQVAMERHMACGVGTCQSCVVKVRDTSPAGYAYKLCCTDGPVFAARQILWK
jgi:dihydroorotate dehydrogenase electron transfer subunit